MTAIYMDGFDHYGTDMNNMAQSGWNISNPANVLRLTTPSFGARTGDKCLARSVLGGSETYARRTLPSGLTNMFVSFGFATDGLPGTIADTRFFTVRAADTSILYGIYLTATGAIRINGSGVDAYTAGPVIVPNTWYFIEMQFNTAGNFVLRINDSLGTETPVLQTALAGGTIAIVELFQGTSDAIANTSNYIDDFFLRNSSGSVNNGFLGDRRIATMFPNSDSADDGWTPHFYKQISVGHARLAYIQTPSVNTVNPTAVIKTAHAAALSLGGSDYTLETFVRFDKLPVGSQYFTLFNKWNETHASGRSYQFRFTGPDEGSCLQLRTTTDGTSSDISVKVNYPWAPEIGTWYHVALCRSAGELLLFVDGQQLGLPIADPDIYFATSNAAMSIGTQLNSSTTSGTGVTNTTVIGRLDETRFTNGIGRYTGSFTPPTTKFPRGAVDDPDWSSVVLLMGYDQGVLDESSYARTIVTSNGATSILAIDGDPPGAFTTVNKPIPDDNTFIRASLVSATNIFTMTTNPTDGDTVTVGNADGSPAVYTFKDTLASAYDVLIGADYVETLSNLIEGINSGTGEGTIYGTGTLANSDVLASSLPAGQILVTALTAGTVGNSIAVGTSSPGVWDDPSTLTGGQNIPGRSSFRLERPPINTTIISAVQITSRARKTDSGVGSMKTALIGPLGGMTESADHALTVGGAVYNDIIELDPDTSAPISPTTLINGKVSVNRTN